MMLVAGVALRWLSLGALAALTGGLVLEEVVVRGDDPSLVSARRALAGWTRRWALVLGLASLGQLLERADAMTQAGLAATLATVPTVLGRTHFGTVWMVRLLALAAILVAARARPRAARRALLALAGLVALTTCLSGHAADRGDLSADVLIDWIHAVLASGWTGGLLALAVAVLGRAGPWPPGLLGLVARRFSRLAAICLAGVVLSGAYRAWTMVPDLAALWTSPYGRLLLAKLVVVGGLVGLGAVNRWTVVPRLPGARGRPSAAARAVRLGRLALRGPSRGGRRGAGSRLAAYVRREAVVALAVFGCTAALGESTPARHAGHRPMPTQPGSYRVSMEALHEHGGVPPGWMFRLPDGDAGRGRRLFAGLRCYACHRVSGEGFPPPGGPGPDLSGMGAHHPAAYLAESIVNPGAVVVEGPGYTGADGRSIMPDYHDRLSVTDLADLVAYLTTLRP